MDQAPVLYAFVSFLVFLISSLYAALIFWSPQSIITYSSEKKYRCRTSPNKPIPLPYIDDPATVDLSIIVPTYNETKRMPRMLESTIKHILSIPERKTEILIIDDGSADGTADLALEYAKENLEVEIRVITREKNSGKGGAVRHGMLHARGERLLMVDADGASRFEDLELLWAALDRLDEGNPNHVAIAVGSRAHLVKTEAVVKRSFLRNLLMYGFHTILRVLGVGHIRDTQCGFKLFTRTAVQQIFPCQHLTTWIFDVEVLLLAKMLRIPVEEVPIEWHEVAGSKLNVVTDSLQMLRDLLILRANHLLGRWKVSQNTVKIVPSELISRTSM
ncbi:Alg5-prov protein [Thelephora ganbajun]|uniref:Alg5-prov protein n=1 Tax=Thelephora ganbajun TaxID=370292 RepID=A0ACB6ZGU3_THEGA|nr:Alg5-prov protein [Thelephora ganbajun]